MHRLVVVAMLALGCGSSRDECTQLKAKVRPLLEGMLREARKPADRAMVDELTAQFCIEPMTESDRRMRQCLLDAHDQPAAAACLETEFKAYADDLGASRARTEAKLAKLRAERDELERKIADQRAPTPADATPADAAIDARPAADVATLPEWPVPAHVAAAGPPTEVYAVDEDADRLLVQLAGKGPLLVAATKRKVTGKVIARSQSEAFAALAAQIGVTPSAPRLSGGGATIELAFGGAPQRDLFAVLADTMRVNIVSPPGELPDVDVVLHRVPAGAALAAVVAFDGQVTKRAGDVIYVLAKDAKLPAPLKLAGAGKLDLDAQDATPGELAAALGRVAKLSSDLCGGAKVGRLRLHKIPLAEAARAIAVATGATWSPAGTCPLATSEVTTLDPAARLVVTVRTGSASAALINTGGAAAIVTNAKVFADAIEVGSASLHLPTTWSPPPDRFDAWLAQVKRTSSLVRSGTKWAARLDNGSLVEETHNEIPDLWGAPISIGPAGVTLPAQGPVQTPITIPLAR